MMKIEEHIPFYRSDDFLVIGLRELQNQLLQGLSFEYLKGASQMSRQGFAEVKLELLQNRQGFDAVEVLHGSA